MAKKIKAGVLGNFVSRPHLPLPHLPPGGPASGPKFKNFQNSIVLGIVKRRLKALRREAPSIVPNAVSE